jgi:putative flippase GtrA
MPMQAAAHDQRHAVLLRYAIASAVALAGDYAIFLALLRLGLAPVVASVLGYVSGIAIHWIASSRAVFATGVAPAGPARSRQKALFVVTALAGLVLTGATVTAGTLAGFDPRAAKLAAIGSSFLVTWHLRRRLVFP